MGERHVRPFRMDSTMQLVLFSLDSNWKANTFLLRNFSHPENQPVYKFVFVLIVSILLVFK